MNGQGISLSGALFIVMKFSLVSEGLNSFTYELRYLKKKKR